MRNNKRLDSCYELNYLLIYLILSDNIEEDLDGISDIIITPDFITLIKYLLELNLNYQLFPKKIIDNLSKMLDNINKTLKNNNYTDNQVMDLYKSCIADLESIGDADYYEYYNNELLKRMDDLYEYSCNSCFAWKREDLEKSIRFDFELLSLLRLEDNKYYNYAPSLLLNSNVIYSLKAMLLDYPTLFNDPKIKRRILDILKDNINLLNNEDTQTLMDLYKENNMIDGNVDRQVISKIKKESINLFNRINKLNKYNSSIDLDNIKTFYHQVMLESILLASSEEKFDQASKIYTDEYLNLDYLYAFILSNNEILSTSLKIKNRLINLMHSFKEKYKLDKEIYNSYLTKINSIKIEENVYIKYPNAYKFDYILFETLICSEDEFENYKELVLQSEYYLDSVKRLFNNCVDLFNNPTVIKRINIILDEGLEGYSDTYHKIRSKKIQKSINRKR